MVEYLRPLSWPFHQSWTCWWWNTYDRWVDRFINLGHVDGGIPTTPLSWPFHQSWTCWWWIPTTVELTISSILDMLMINTYDRWVDRFINLGHVDGLVRVHDGGTHGNFVKTHRRAVLGGTVHIRDQGCGSAFFPFFADSDPAFFQYGSGSGRVYQCGSWSGSSCFCMIRALLPASRISWA